MKYLVVLLALSFGTIQSLANPIERISNGKNSTGLYYYACNILVLNIANETVHLGGGSIITNRHVLTTASLIYGKGNSYRIDYRAQGIADYQHAAAYIAMTHNEFNPETLENDIAIIFLPLSARRFTVDSLMIMGKQINIPSAARLPVAVVGHGYTSPTDKEMSRIPYYANLTTDGLNDTCNRSSSTIFCAVGGSQGVLCPGDVGSGVVTHLNGLGKAILIGLVSKLPNNNCVFTNNESLNVSYTAVGLYEEWIQTVTGIQYF